MVFFFLKYVASGTNGLITFLGFDASTKNAWFLKHYCFYYIDDTGVLLRCSLYVFMFDFKQHKCMLIQSSTVHKRKLHKYCIVCQRSFFLVH